MVNGGPIPTGVRVPLHDGDDISIGAWTKLRIMAGGGRPD
jgi:hypothetical protein